MHQHANDTHLHQHANDTHLQAWWQRGLCCDVAATKSPGLHSSAVYVQLLTTHAERVVLCSNALQCKQEVQRVRDAASHLGCHLLQFECLQLLAQWAGGAGCLLSPTCSVSRLNRDDLPTFGRPRRPIFRLFLTLPNLAAPFCSPSSAFLGGMAVCSAARAAVCMNGKL